MISEDVLIELYCKCQLSMAEVASKLRTTHATVLYWLKKHEITRRSWSESTYAKLNRNGDPFKIPEHLSNEQRELMVAGLLLYWAEGSKLRGSTRIANLDHRMLTLFARFLREVCHVEEKRLSLYVRVYRQFSLSEAKRYWSQLLSLAPSQVFVYQHSDKRSKLYKQWSKYGIATLEFHNTKFKLWLNQTIENYLEGFKLGHMNGHNGALRAPGPLSPAILRK